MALSLDYLCPPGQTNAYFPHYSDYAAHPQISLAHPGAPHGGGGAGGRRGH